MIEISQFSDIWVVIEFCVLSNMIIAITVINNENIIELLIGKQTKLVFPPSSHQLIVCFIIGYIYMETKNSIHLKSKAAAYKKIAITIGNLAHKKRCMYIYSLRFFPLKDVYT